MSQRDWEALVRIALLGTGRAELPPFPESSPYGKWQKQIALHPPETALLDTTALLFQYYRAGEMPAFPPLTSPSPAPPEKMPVCSPKAGELLLRMVNGSFVSVFPEWLDLLQAHKQRVPAEYLPLLLDFGRNRPLQHLAIIPLLGERGNWLVQQNPAWRYALDIRYLPKRLLKQKWEAGRQRVRLNIFAQMRHQMPDKARDWLQSIWEDEPQTNRNQLIQLMKVGLTMADEPFLESCLDHRSHSLRTNLLNLLVQLPASRLCQRMRKRALPIFDFQNDEYKLTELSESREALKRDGVMLRRTHTGHLDSWRFIQLLTRVPLDAWCDHWGMPASEFVNLGRQSKHGRTVMRGWAKATILQNSTEWAESLLAIPERHWLNSYQEGLIKLLPINQREKYVFAEINRKDRSKVLQTGHPVLTKLNACDHIWSEQLTRQAIQHIARRLRTEKSLAMPGTTFEKKLMKVVHFCPPSMVDEVAEMMEIGESAGRGWRKINQRFVTTLAFRKALQEAF